MAFGIDFGTTHTVIAYYNELTNEIIILRLDPFSFTEGTGDSAVHMIPSIINYIPGEKQGEYDCYIGNQVLEKGMKCSANTMKSMKLYVNSNIDFEKRFKSENGLNSIKVSMKRAIKDFLERVLKLLPEGSLENEQFVFSIPNAEKPRRTSYPSSLKRPGNSALKESIIWKKAPRRW